MPTPAEIREDLADIVGKIAEVSPDSVRDTAILKELGIDSVGTVELAEGVAKSFNITLDDDSVNEWRTIGDVVRSVQRATAYAAAVAEPTAAPDKPTSTAAAFLSALPPPQLSDPERIGAFKQLAIVFALIGAGLGVIIGIGAAALLTSSGLDAGTLPPISTPAVPTPVATDTVDSERRFTPPPFRGDDVTASPTPASGPAELTATPSTVASGEQFELNGRLPEATPGERLIVEMSEDGTTWESFPITLTANSDGSFGTHVYIATAGERQFRVRSENSGTQTPATTVQIS